MAGTERMSVADARKLLGADLKGAFERGSHRGGKASGLVARGRVRTKREEGMNALEEAYEREVLLPALRLGEILWYAYEAVKLRLADNTFLTIDFFVMTRSGELEAHETKGYMEEDANVKWKVVRAQFPFRFKLVRNKDVRKKSRLPGAGWDVEVCE